MGSLSRFDLSRIIKEYNTVNLFETGTFLGDSVAFALKEPFSKIVSVEIVSEIATKAKSRFADDEKVIIIEGDSISALKEQLPHLKGNTIFWLDAHFPGADAGLEQYDSMQDEDIRLPLEKELTIIHQIRKNYQDVFIIDDLRVYEDGPYENGYAPAVTLPKSNRNLDFVQRLFKHTHSLFKSYRDEGYLFLFPIGSSDFRGVYPDDLFLPFDVESG